MHWKISGKDDKKDGALLLCMVIPVLFLLLVYCLETPQVHPPSSITTVNVPPVPAVLTKKYEDYQQWQSAALFDWLPGGTGMLVRRRARETEQLHTVAAPGDPVRMLTFYGESVLFAHVCPDSARKCVVFTKDIGGDERFQLFRMDFATSQVVRLTKDSVQNGGVVWSRKGDRIAWSSNRRNGKDFDVYVMDPERPGHDILIFRNKGAWSAIDWSPDDRKLLLGKYESRTCSRLYILDIASGKMRPLTDTTCTVSQEMGLWGSDGNTVFFTSDEDTDFRSLRCRNIKSGRERICTGDIPWDVREIALSPDGNTLAFTTNENGFSGFFLMDTRSFEYKRVETLPQAIIGTLRFHPDGCRCAMTVNAPYHPEDVYVIDMRSLEVTRWTRSRLGGIDQKKLVTPEIIRYQTFDSTGGTSRMIPCFVYRPKSCRKPCPVLILLHGGPESQFWPSFRPEIQFYCTELGIAVVAPNVRGSGGYGKRYLTLDDGRKREDAVRDVGALLDWLAGQKGFDTSRMAVTGGSYGGYLALASTVRFGDRLRACIDSYGISNFVTFLENTSLYRRDLRRAEYGDERDPDMRKFLNGISPLTHVNRITNPLLIIQGANDARVPLGESEQIAEALRKNGTDVWMVVAGDEGHGFRKKSNRDYKEWVSALFLERFLCDKR